MTTSVKNVNLADLSSHDPKTKYGSARSLLAIAKDSPSELYPHIEQFVELLYSENRILKWTAIDIIGLLSKVDEKGKIDILMGKMFGLLNTGNMITANHAIAALADIAVAKPEYQNRITAELLKVEHYDYDTDECRNIALGKVILALGAFSGQIEDKRAVGEFVERQTKNTRNATKKKAEQLLKKLSKGN